MSTRATIFALTLAASALVGCYRPHGAMIPWDGAPQTYCSTEMSLRTIHVVDLRTDEIIFAMDIPPGKQLTFDFVTGEGDDPVYSPDLMRYEVFNRGTQTGKLTNAMSVPNAACRRIDMYQRLGPEYMTAAPDRMLRTDELTDRPEWWTPGGGELPEDQKGVGNYDK